MLRWPGAWGWTLPSRTVRDVVERPVKLLSRVNIDLDDLTVSHPPLIFIFLKEWKGKDLSQPDDIRIFVLSAVVLSSVSGFLQWRWNKKRGKCPLLQFSFSLFSCFSLSFLQWSKYFCSYDILLCINRLLLRLRHKIAWNT